MSSGITPELRWHAIGRRKLGIARVYLTPGSGKWSINGRTLGDYFPRPSLVSHIQQPFTATDTLGAFDVKAPMPGLVVRVEVSEGQVVEIGEGLVVVEAMKMENELRALHKGVVEAVHVRAGDRVEKGTPLVTLSPQSAQPSG